MHERHCGLSFWAAIGHLKQCTPQSCALLGVGGGGGEESITGVHSLDWTSGLVDWITDWTGLTVQCSGATTHPSVPL